MRLEGNKTHCFLEPVILCFLMPPDSEIQEELTECAKKKIACSSWSPILLQLQGTQPVCDHLRVKS